MSAIKKLLVIRGLVTRVLKHLDRLTRKKRKPRKAASEKRT